MPVLDEIFTHQRGVVAGQKRACPLPEMQAAASEAAPPLDFLAGLQAAPSRPALIAEIKHRSPSRGTLTRSFDPLQLAGLYAQNGAAAISVLTEEKYFGGQVDHLRAVAALRRAKPGPTQSQAGLLPQVPLLRKDFICDPYQVYQSRAAGADAVLLIVAGLQPVRLRELHELVVSLHMTPLVEVHTLEELRAALDLEPVLVGINNRDLRDFTVNLATTLHLRPYVPPRIKVVAESGIHTEQDVVILAEAGVDAILVGEALVTAADIPEKVRQLSRLPELLPEQKGGRG